MMECLNNELIFIGSLYPAELKADLLNNNAFVDYPADVLQQAILKGLDDNGCDFRVLSSVRLSGYPIKRKILFKSIYFSHDSRGDNRDIYVGGINQLVINEIFAIIKLSHYLRLNTREKRKDLLIYAIGIPSLFAILVNKKRVNSVTLIVPDLPEFMSGNKNWFYRTGKKISTYLANRLMRNVDKFVLLSSYMRDRLPVKKDSWLLMEGIYDESKRLEKTIKSEHKVVLYTGNLSKRYGILELLNAFRQIEDDNYRLWICGNGDGKEDVISMAMIDKRIEYKGVLSHDEVLLLQKQATILVNPRSSAGEYTKYSFPSKTMEYLASGTPTIMCHLPAIPKEYDDYLFYFTDESAEGIKDKIVEVCSKSNDELMSFGEKAADFIINNKTPKIQMGRVLSFISQEQN